MLEQQLTLDDSLQAELKLKDQLIDNQKQQIVVLQTTNSELSGALKDTRAVLPKAERSVVESPHLWFGIGVVVGIVAVSVTAVVIHNALH